MSLDALLSTPRTTSEVLDTILIYLRPYQWYAFDAAVACTTVWALLRWLRTSRRQVHTTQLRGPPSESFLYGVNKRILDAENSGAIYEAWAVEYGPVYAIPSTFGTKKIVLNDPKAIAHFYSKDTWTYTQTPATRKVLANILGKGLLWAYGENHKRQRKSLTPAFSIAAIRQLTSIFYDSAYKAKGAWDAFIESNGGDSALIEVQIWCVSLDTIGLAGFSHNFGALQGKHAHVTEIFDTFAASPRSTAVNTGLLLLAQVFPFLVGIPTAHRRLVRKLSVAMEEISNVLLSRTQKELEIGVVGDKEERSIIGLLSKWSISNVPLDAPLICSTRNIVKGANEDSGFQLTKDEVMAQVNESLCTRPRSASSTLWALLELSRNPDVQTELRNELLEHGVDPTYDQLTNGLPYLDAVVHEILRVHPPVVEITRIAIEDDVIPLSEPVRTKTGQLVDSLTIAKDTLITVSMESMNRSAAMWGEDAKMFRPSRWLEDAHGQDGIPAKAKEIQGHRHLLTFVDGPRTCLGKNFAVTEFKAVLTVLVKNFIFELRDGVDSKIEIGRGMLPRPKIAGEVGCKLPLRVRPYVA
ncbi:cytochrome P450 [Butyriboletus roseoflavus]|nr:cytochrome P450 [Butyriboletus roseoflavus]